MAEFDLVILNGLLVTHQATGELDIAIKDGKVVKVVSRGSLVGAQAKKTIDAQGGVVMVSNFEYTFRGNFN